MKDDKLYLIHIIECIEKIETYAQDGRDAFLSDTKTQDAVVRNLQILAESTQRISEPLKVRRAEVDWRAIAAFRNVVVHDYLGIDKKQIWEIVERDIPDLRHKIKTILQELERLDETSNR